MSLYVFHTSDYYVKNLLENEKYANQVRIQENYIINSNQFKELKYILGTHINQIFQKS